MTHEPDQELTLVTSETTYVNLMCADGAWLGFSLLAARPDGMAELVERSSPILVGRSIRTYGF